MSTIEDTVATIRPADAEVRARAVAHLEQLTMPHWALGRLMDLAADLAAATGTLQIPHARRLVVVMAADHGVTKRGVSQYPSDVTSQMVRNFAAGGAGINALTKVAGSELLVVDMGVAGDLRDLVASGGLLDRRQGDGTADLSAGAAMTRATARACVEAGIAVAAERAADTDVIATGDMGIGNTTASAAIAAVLTGQDVDAVTGRGTGIDDDGLTRKRAVIRQALQVNAPDADDPLDVLAKVGGYEIGGLTGVILWAAARRRIVVIDGFISTAAALLACAFAPATVDHLVLAHRSAEAGHRAMLEHLGKAPLLELDLRLGEGTGAALAMPLVEAAARLLTDVHTFAQAGVSGPS